MIISNFSRREQNVNIWGVPKFGYIGLGGGGGGGGWLAEKIPIVYVKPI